MKKLRIILCDESGQSLTEYSLILSLVALVAISVVILFGKSVLGLFETVRDYVVNAL